MHTVLWPTNYSINAPIWGRVHGRALRDSVGVSPSISPYPKDPRSHETLPSTEDQPQHGGHLYLLLAEVGLAPLDTQHYPSKGSSAQGQSSLLHWRPGNACS